MGDGFSVIIMPSKVYTGNMGHDSDTKFDLNDHPMTKTPMATYIRSLVCNVLKFVYAEKSGDITFYVFDWGEGHRPESHEYNLMFGKNPCYQKLPFDSAVYIYYWPLKSDYLKIGMVSENSYNRFYKRHYEIVEKGSSLAKSIIKNRSSAVFADYNLDESKIEEWIESNLQRIDIIFETKVRFAANLVESYLHVVLNPRFEGIRKREDYTI